MNPLFSRCLPAACLALAASGAIAQVSPTGYTLVDLGPVGAYRNSYANGGNTNAGYVAVVCSNGSPYQAARYTPGQGVQLLTGLGGVYSYSQGVNGLGWVVGWASTKSGVQRPTLWKGTTAIDLTGKNGQANGINNLASPQVVGYSQNGRTNQGFMWQNGTVTFIPMGSAVDINDYSEVIGGSGNNGVYWKAGMSSATVLQPLVAGAVIYVYKINNNHLIAGSSNTSGPEHAVIWNTNGSVFRDLGSFNSSDTEALGINSANCVVGHYYPPTGSERPFIADPATGQLTDLNDVLDHIAYPGWTLISAWGINDSGQITGDASINGVDHAYVLIPK